MKVDPMAKAYAHALYQVAQAEERVDRVEDELFQIRKLIEKQHELQDFLRDHNISSEAKKKALSEILGKDISQLTLNHLEFVVDQERASLIPQIAQAFSDLILTTRNQIMAEVTTAIPLTPELAEKLRNKLSKATGQEVIVKNLVDESILGGAIVRLGDKVINGSIKHNLEELHENLVSAELKE